MMDFHAFDTWWWPYLFILLAGWLASDIWRFIGVAIGGRLDEESEALVLARAIATALVAAVIGKLIVFPSGAVADTSVFVRIAAAGIGFAAYLAAGRRVIAGVVVAEAILMSAYLLA
jgi:hypothetical protein